MPGWHAKTKDLAAAGKLQVLGIAQEQHVDRTRLFMQWHQMDWPVMADPFNLLAVSAVPITLFVDEHGIIRAKNPKPTDLDAFLSTTFEPTGDEPETITTDIGSYVRCSIPRCVDAALKNRAEQGQLENLSATGHFHTGVLFRMRHDSAEFRQPTDFADAVHHWREARNQNPNQYIWRRRIQQYGPRLDKPYSFYDWVPEARAAITARGETPVPLTAEPSGAEFARPAKSTTSATPTTGHPDPDSKINRDLTDLLTATTVVVPSTDSKKTAYRIHLTFTPNPDLDAHWNNETGPAHLWVNDQLLPVSASQHFSVSDFKTPATSTEPRTVEFETAALPVTVTLYFDTCQGEQGVCRHLAKDITITAR